MKSNNSADPMHDAGGPAEGPGERGCLEGGRGGEQASRAGLMQIIYIWKQTFEAPSKLLEHKIHIGSLGYLVINLVMNLVIH